MPEGLSGQSRRNGIDRAEAYLLVYPPQFASQPIAYCQKLDGSDAAWADPKRFFTPMAVKQTGGAMFHWGLQAIFLARESSRWIFE